LRATWKGEEKGGSKRNLFGRTMDHLSQKQRRGGSTGFQNAQRKGHRLMSKKILKTKTVKTHARGRPSAMRRKEKGMCRTGWSLCEPTGKIRMRFILERKVAPGLRGARRGSTIRWSTSNPEGHKSDQPHERSIKTKTKKRGRTRVAGTSKTGGEKPYGFDGATQQQ